MSKRRAFLTIEKILAKTVKRVSTALECLGVHPLIFKKFLKKGWTLNGALLLGAILSPVLLSPAWSQYGQYSPYSQYPPQQTQPYSPYGQYGQYGQSQSPSIRSPYGNYGQAMPPTVPSARPPQYPPAQSAAPPVRPAPQYNYGGSYSGNDAGNTAAYDQYAALSQQANEAIEKGELSRAIDLMEKALPLAPDASVPVLYNNLATIYMRRGNYYHDKEHDDKRALADFRVAAYYIDIGWPEGLERKPLHEGNLKIARDNLRIAYDNLKLPNTKEKHLEMAKALRMQGLFKEALVEYAQVSAVESGNSESLTAMGDLFNVMNSPEKSKKYYQKLTQVNPNGASADVWARLGHAQDKTGEAAAALKSLNKALELDPGNMAALNLLETLWQRELKFNPANIAAHANLASILQKKKQYDDAMREYKAAEQLANQDPRTPFDIKRTIRLNMGTLMQETGKPDQAMEAYNTVLQVEPKNPLALYYKATLLRDTGKTAEAVATYFKVLDADPKNADTHEDLIALLFDPKYAEQTKPALAQYAQRVSDNADIQARVGETFHQRKEYERAVEYYRKALALNPKLAGVQANLGAALQAMGKTEEATLALKRAAELDPANATVKGLLVDVQAAAGYALTKQALDLQQSGQHHEALPIFEKALATDPDNPEMRFAYAVSLHNDKQLDKAIQEYQAVAAQAPGNAEYQYYLATALHQKGNLAAARKAYQESLRLKPDYPEAAEGLGLINQQESNTLLETAVAAYGRADYKKVLETTDAALKKSPENATAYYYQGLAYTASGKGSLAVQSYRSALRYDPSFTDGYYALGVALDQQNDKPGAQEAYQKFVELSESALGGDTATAEPNEYLKYAKDRLTALKAG